MKFRWKKKYSIALFAAFLGGGMVLLLEHLVFKIDLKKLFTNSIQQEIFHLKRSQKTLDPCTDLSSVVCSIPTIRDVSGEVLKESEGELKVLRVYEKIVKDHPKSSVEEIDNLLVKEIYSKPKIKRIKNLFQKVKKGTLNFIDEQPFNVLSEAEKNILRDRILKIELQLPPPASVYSDEPDLFTKSEVFYERMASGGMRIRIGGALLYSVNSKYNLAFTLTHEIAHSIDPCELKEAKVGIHSYTELVRCLGTPPEALIYECQPHGKLSEIFADWMATNVIAKILEEDSRKLTSRQVKFAVFNSIRDLCIEEDQLADEEEDSSLFFVNHPNRSNAQPALVEATKKPQLASAHPSDQFRMNRIFGQHPVIRELLGCVAPETPPLPEEETYCFLKGKKDK
jgi:hypothetical protein